MDENQTASIENALELLLYAERYRNTVVVLVLEPGIAVRRVVDALRVFELAHIRCLVFSTPYPALEDELNTLSRRGIQLHLAPVPPETNPEIVIKEDFIQVFALESCETLSALSLRCFSITRSIAADKVFLCTDEQSLLEHFRLPLVSPQDVRNGDNTHKELLAIISSEVEVGRRDVVILPGRSSALYQEVFTYQGAGTLITSSPPNQARPAELSDVLAISQLMKPYIKDGSLVHMSEDNIARRVAEFMVYTVHEAVVGAARLSPHGVYAELGSICTLPRYRGQGLARDLIEAMFASAKARGFEKAFALSTRETMQRFFLSLGMEELDRAGLPDSWKANYDLSRPSRAFLKVLR